MKKNSFDYQISRNEMLFLDSMLNTNDKIIISDAQAKGAWRLFIPRADVVLCGDLDYFEMKRRDHIGYTWKVSLQYEQPYVS